MLFVLNNLSEELNLDFLDKTDARVYLWYFKNNQTGASGKKD